MVPQMKITETRMPSCDDGWWASVLADEERYTASASSRQTKAENKSRIQTNWGKAKILFDQDAIVTMLVTGYNRGGLLVEGEGMNGFVPFSHLVEMVGQTDTVNREKSLSAYVGKAMRLKVIECVPEDGRIVFSERAALAESGRRTMIFRSLKPGQSLWGDVTNITDFGVFVDLGGVEGLIHISELSWGRVSHPSQIVTLGQHIAVQVLEVSPERCRIALSLKRLTENPWEASETYYDTNQIVPAVVTSIVSFGAFARLQEGFEGLIHASEMPLSPGMSVYDLLEEGQQIQVRILHIDMEHQRLGLSLKLHE